MRYALHPPPNDVHLGFLSVLFISFCSSPFTSSLWSDVFPLSSLRTGVVSLALYVSGSLEKFNGSYLYKVSVHGRIKVERSSPCRVDKVKTAQPLSAGA